MNQCRIAIVDSNPRMHGRLAMLLGQQDLIRAFLSIDSVVSHAGDVPLVIVVGPSMTSPSDLGFIAQVLEQRPNTSVVFAIANPTERLMMWASQVGVSDIINLTAEEEQLAPAVEAAIHELMGLTVEEAPEQYEQEYEAPAPKFRPTYEDQYEEFEEEPEEIEPFSATDMDDDMRRDSGKVITVFSTKGGSGKSVIATNLAVTLARTSNAPVVLLDADFQFGDLAVMMKLRPKHSLTDAIAALNRMDVEMAESLLTMHEPSGVLVLPSPFEPTIGSILSPADMVRIIDLMAQIGGHVVIDTSSHIDEVTVAILQRSSEILLVGNMDIPSMKDMKIGLQMLRSLNVPINNARLVMNRANSKAKLDTREVERALHMKVDALLASDVLIPQSVNKRTPAVLEAPKSSIAQTMERLAGLMGETF